MLVVASIGGLALCGCSPRMVGYGESHASRDDSSRFDDAQAVGSQAGASNTIDAGVVFADASSYLCFPLKRFGVESSVQVESITSTCHCVRGKVVVFRDTRGKAADALRIDFLPEEDAKGSGSAGTSEEASAANLMVELTLHLRGGRSQVVTIEFLQTRSVSANCRDSANSPVRSGAGIPGATKGGDV